MANYCEIHPHVSQTYPCQECIMKNERERLYKKERDDAMMEVWREEAERDMIGSAFFVGFWRWMMGSRR